MSLLPAHAVYTCSMTVASRQNPIVKRFREAARAHASEMLLDGAHLLEEAVEAGLDIEVVAVNEAAVDRRVGALVDRAAARGARAIGVTESVLSAISPVHKPSGVVALAKRPETALNDALAGVPPLALLLSDVQDPGNVGAIIRVAEACRVTGIVPSEHSADPFGWKALRGSMGSAFRMRVAGRQPLEPAIAEARARGLTIHAAVPRGGRPLPKCDFFRPSAILLGGEGPGLSPALFALADEHITIPMQPPVESLNVATAAAMILYQAMLRRYPELQ
jgi:RNA methyltransferase, TrmH family